MHIGIIPDGNRRFMLKKSLSLESSYRAGIEKFYDVLQWCKDAGAKEVTVYALSLENINSRSDAELMTLVEVFAESAKKVLSEDMIHKDKIHIKICGDIDYLRERIRAIGSNSDLVDNLNELEKSTENYDSLMLNLAIAYGGRQEIINAVKTLRVKNKEITAENIQKNLWVKDDADIIIRTGETRISNFLLWQSHYAEIYFIPRLWPEITKDDIEGSIKKYKNREKRYGK